MIEVSRCGAYFAAGPETHCSIQRCVVKLEPAGQQSDAYMPPQCMVSPHHRRVRLVHRAQHPGMLLEVALSRREFVFFHQMLLCSEYLLHPFEQLPICCAYLMVPTTAELMDQLSQQLMGIGELSDFREHGETPLRKQQGKNRKTPAEKRQDLKGFVRFNQRDLSFTLVLWWSMSSGFDQFGPDYPRTCSYNIRFEIPISREKRSVAWLTKTFCSRHKAKLV